MLWKESSVEYLQRDPNRAQTNMNKLIQFYITSSDSVKTHRESKITVTVQNFFK